MNGLRDQAGDTELAARVERLLLEAEALTSQMTPGPDAKFLDYLISLALVEVARPDRE